jgi:hypothetical protein
MKNVLHYFNYRNSSEFKGKHEIDNNSAAEFNTKFIYILLTLNEIL